jgi:iron complex transport system ATP-binding protein
MHAAGIESLADRWVGQLSGGEQQRVLIARALAQQPRVLLLDEATAHLDVHHQISILGLVRTLAHQGRVVLAALHDLNLAALYADHLVLLAHGTVLASGPPAQVLTAALIEQAFGVSVIIATHPFHGTPLVMLRDR